jgi:hypothetical protein
MSKTISLNHHNHPSGYMSVVYPDIVHVGGFTPIDPPIVKACIIFIYSNTIEIGTLW